MLSLHWSQQTEWLQQRRTLLLFQRQQNGLDFLYVTAQNVWYQGLVLEVETNTQCIEQVSVIVKHLYSNEYFFKHCKIAKARKWLNLLCMIKYVVFFTTIYIRYLYYQLKSQKIKHKLCCCNILQKFYKMQKLTCAKKKFTDFLRFCKVCNKWRKLDIH